MTLDDIYTQILYGELRHVFADSNMQPAETIPKDKRGQLLSSIQLGLTELHKRFLLKEARLTLEIIPGKQAYVLDKRYAQSNVRSKEVAKYINDVSEPFLDNLFKIERVYGADGTELALNVVENAASLRTSGYDCLVMPDDFAETSVKVVYRADHPTIDSNLASIAPSQLRISLPSTHLEALLLYVAGRYTMPVGMSNEFHEGNNYMQRFEASCARLEVGGYQIQQDLGTNRFDAKGFV